MKNIALVGIIVLIVAACTSAPAEVTPTGDVKEITIDSYNWGFTQSPEEIKKGDRVRLTVTSSSGAHGINIPEFGVSTGTIGPGGKEVVEFTATKSGTFAYYCSVYCGDGHREMQGVLTVSE